MRDDQEVPHAGPERWIHREELAVQRMRRGDIEPVPPTARLQRVETGTQVPDGLIKIAAGNTQLVHLGVIAAHDPKARCCPATRD